MHDDQQADPFTISFVPGVTITKWTRAWAERTPDVPLGIVRTAETDQVAVLHVRSADVSFVRLPIDAEGLRVIPLYREIAVVVVPKDHAIAAADSVTLADLAGEKIQQDPEAFDLVAAGVGVLILPQSIARLQSRKDLVARPVTDAAETQIALAWLAGLDDDVLAARIEEFVGIVRGRTAHSSRAPGAEDAAAETKAVTKSAEKAAAKRANAAKAAAKSGAKSGGTSAAKAGAASAGSKKTGASTRGGSYGQQRKADAARKKHRGR